MPASPSSPRLTFRIKRSDAEGTTTVEEREVVGCSQQALLELLCAPWEAFEEATRPEAEAGLPPEETADALGRAFARHLEGLEAVVTESREDDGTRRFTLSFRPQSPPPASGPAPEAVATAGDDEPLTLHLRADVQMTANGENDVLLENENNQEINVRNRAIFLTSRNNLFANIYFELVVVYRAQA
ncbi:MAG: hypothetical protein KatS3mg043_2038 [Rhodothermaceae bacterium]|nr:MAG: hypothetical protein KatS3mg043_2038 [Rhodothermaceae bacterium]